MADTTKDMSTTGGHEPADGITSLADQQQQMDSSRDRHSSKLVRFYAHPWTQIILISFICFCLPGVSVN
jgi:hypothetical protein